MFPLGWGKLISRGTYLSVLGKFFWLAKRNESYPYVLVPSGLIWQKSPLLTCLTNDRAVTLVLSRPNFHEKSHLVSQSPPCKAETLRTLHRTGIPQVELCVYRWV